MAGDGDTQRAAVERCWNQRVIRHGDMLGGSEQDGGHANKYSSFGVLKAAWRSLGIRHHAHHVGGCFSRCELIEDCDRTCTQQWQSSGTQKPECQQNVGSDRTDHCFYHEDANGGGRWVGDVQILILCVTTNRTSSCFRKSGHF